MKNNQILQKNCKYNIAINIQMYRKLYDQSIHAVNSKLIRH